MRKIPPYLLLDAWRGIAALWVVMVHACLAFLANNDNGRFVSLPLYAVSIWGQLGVTMFFIISGYCITGAAYGALASGRSAGRYGLDRIRRIYPPYLAACVAALALGLLTGLAQNHHLLPPSNHPAVYNHALLEPRFWVANLLIMQAQFGQPTLIFVAWSLTYEIVFYALIFVLLVLARAFARHPSDSMRIPVFQMGIAGLTFASLAWLVISPENCPFPLDRWYQFGLGALLFLVFTAETAFTARIARGQLVFAGILTLAFAIRHDLSSSTGVLVGHFVFGHPSTRLQAATCLIFILALLALRPIDAHLAHRRALRPLM
jgi:exopolysaccharide production protein ExoZ